MIKKLSLLILAAIGLHGNAWATHNRAGEILYEYDTSSPGTLTYIVTIITWTKESSHGADRQYLTIHWGDGTSDSLARTDTLLYHPAALDIKRNRYVGRHTYPAFGMYVLYMADPNRIDGICNIGQSVNVPFEVEDTLRIPDPAFYNFDNSPQIQNPPIDFYIPHSIFTYNPNAYDPDGDSLDYELTIPKQAPGQVVPGYASPTVQGGGVLTLDHKTGQLEWNVPNTCCIFNIAILIREFRGGNCIGSMVLDMEIINNGCTLNDPPVIQPLHNYCILANTTLDVTVHATDPNPGQYVYLNCNGGPFVVTPLSDTADFTSTSGLQFANGAFQWHPTCDQVRAQDYSVVVRATDSYGVPGSTIENFNIKVVAPEPKNLTATPQGNSILLQWQNPYECDGSRRFMGFEIWRREGCGLPFSPDTCNTNMSGSGYTLIRHRWHSYSYTDDNVQRGHQYSYRVQAFFGDSVVLLHTFPGNEFNTTTGLPSAEACAELKMDVPVITQVSVDSTDLLQGVMHVSWVKPNAAQLDTIQNPPPYKYRVYRSADMAGSNWTHLRDFSAGSFHNFNVTSFHDSAIDTKSHPWSYKIAFLANGNDSIGSTEAASSVFLNFSAASHQLTLHWNYLVPWLNDSFQVFKLNPSTQHYNYLHTIVHANSYVDTGLANGSSYCYYVASFGHYSDTAFHSILVNLSERDCGVPIDTVGPCAPVLSVNNSCLDPNFMYGDFRNYLNWSDVVNMPSGCGNDAIGYVIYYKATVDGAYSVVDSLRSNLDLSFLHDLSTLNTVAGCYVVAAYDSNGNRGPVSNVVCVENCPEYNLPNVFTPNQDEHNDVFHPFLPVKYIDHVNFKVFNQWGELVFQTQDPMLGWNGKLMNNGTELPEGTYYYVCDVFAATSVGVQSFGHQLSGFIHLFR